MSIRVKSRVIQESALDFTYDSDAVFEITITNDTLKLTETLSRADAIAFLKTLGGHVDDMDMRCGYGKNSFHNKLRESQKAWDAETVALDKLWRKEMRKAGLTDADSND